VGRLIYSSIASLDGYVADETGNFEWAEPDEEVHAFVNDLERPIGTHLYGRRMYETLAVWEHPDDFAGDSAIMRDYAQIWQSADKVVYSRTLTAVSTAKTRIEEEFDPAAVRALKDASEHDLAIGGPMLAAQAFAAGLVDECHLLLCPIAVGGGTPSLPDHTRIPLQLLDHRRFANGTVHLHYRVR